MPIEVEAKLKIDDHAMLIGRLRSAGAVPVARFFEVNVFFDTSQSSLLAASQGLRLRTLINTETGEKKYIITHKGAKLPGKLKSREETELTVDNPASAEALLSRLGYLPRLRFEKKRWTWELDGCKVELDELPLLGNFVEVEGPAESAILQVCRKLGLSSLEMIDKGYASLIAKLFPAGERINVRFDQTG